MQETDEHSTPVLPLTLRKAFEDHQDVLLQEETFQAHASRNLSSWEYAHAVQFVEKYCTLLRELNEALEGRSTTISGQR